jgi:hypothetical protein
MVNKCVAYGCTSGYKGHEKPAIRITFHSFPKNEELRNRWIHANPRKDFLPSKNSRICSLHFTDSDFIVGRNDTNTKRRLSHPSDQLTKRYLKHHAVPSCFPNAPSYLSSTPTTTRTSATAATSSGRQQQESRRLENLLEQFEAADDLRSLSLDQIIVKLMSESIVPQGFQAVIVDGLLLIYRLQVDNCVPAIRASIAIRSDLSFLCTVDKKQIPAKHFSDLVSGSIQSISQLMNVMARVKAWCDDVSSQPQTLLLEVALKCLEEYLTTLDDTSDNHRRISFVVEQLNLGTKNKYARHYSPELIIFSYLLHSSSPSAYTTLLEQTVVCLPSVKTLSKVTRQVNSNTGLDNMSYLKLRVSKLNEYERTVLLIIDEIYVAKRVEYSAGTVQGLTADGAVASTLLCFMIKSLASKYKDVVAIYPMANLTAAKQNDCYTEVIANMNKAGLYVVAISVDNASTNRKFFTDFLCDGTLKTSITNAETGQPLFLIFDPVHDLKNVYNNFQSRKLFQCPALNSDLPVGCEANFNHIADLYNYEASAALKKAHRLSPSVLDPKSIEKTSVKLATAVFCESTRDALTYYATHNNKADWLGTADFITLILKLWNVMNVKTRTKGKHKRDATMDPVRSSLDWKLDFLREFANFLQRWQATGRGGLTKETFIALRQTCLALADCAAFLLDRRGFNYVLLGHLQSDALEGRFGWLRQLSGANYFISTRQVLESDRKIRAVSLLKFSGISLSAIEDAIQADCSAASDKEADTVADSITASMKLDVEPTDSDRSIIFYVSGYIARSTVSTTKCESCRDALISSEEAAALEVTEELDSRASEFLDNINRGGLVRPTEFVYMLTTHCWRIFEEIRNSSELKSQFLKAASQSTVFGKVMDRSTYNDKFIHLVFGRNVCSAGHNLQNHIVRRFFNCVAKNFVKQITYVANAHHEPTAKKRKVAKLTSSKL